MLNVSVNINFNNKLMYIPCSVTKLTVTRVIVSLVVVYGDVCIECLLMIK